MASRAQRRQASLRAVRRGIDAHVGGLDVNGKIVPQNAWSATRWRSPGLTRPAASTPAMAGSTTTSDLDVRSVRRWRAAAALRCAQDVDVHDGYHSLVMRARLIKYNDTGQPT